MNNSKWNPKTDPSKDIQRAMQELSKSTGVMDRKDEIAFEDFCEALLKRLAVVYKIPIDILRKERLK